MKTMNDNVKLTLTVKQLKQLMKETSNLDDIEEGVLNRLAANVKGVTNFVKGVAQGAKDAKNTQGGVKGALSAAKDVIKKGVDQGHEERYSSILAQHFGKVDDFVTKYVATLNQSRDALVKAGQGAVYDQFVDKVSNVIEILKQNAEKLDLQPQQIPEPPQKSGQGQEAAPAQAPEQGEAPQMKDEEGNVYEGFFDRFKKKPAQPAKQAAPAQAAPAAQSPAKPAAPAPAAPAAKQTAPAQAQAQPQAQAAPAAKQPAQPQAAKPQAGGKENMDKAQEIMTDFIDKLCEFDDGPNGQGRNMIMLVMQNISKGMTPEKAMAAAGIDQATVQKNAAIYAKQGFDVKSMVQEHFLAKASGKSLVEAKDPTEKIVKNLQSFDKKLASIIGELSADLKDMGFDKKDNKAIADKEKELKKKVKDKEITDDEMKKQLDAFKKEVGDNKQNAAGVDGIINRLRKATLQNVDVSLRGADGMTGKQTGFQKFLHFAGKAGMATLIGMAVNTVMPGFAALGMAGPYVNKALVGASLSVIRDASSGQLDKASFKRALVGAAIGCLAQFGKEVMSAPEIVRTDVKEIGSVSNISDYSGEMGLSDNMSSAELFSNGVSSVDAKTELAQGAADAVDRFSNQTLGNIQSYTGKAGNLGTWIRSLFDQRVADQLGDNAIAVDLSSEIENNLGTIMSNVQAGKMNAAAAKEGIDKGRAALEDIMNSKYNDNIPPEAKQAIMRQYDYAGKQVMGRVNGILARIGNHVRDFFGSNKVSGGGKFHGGVASDAAFDAQVTHGLTDDQLLNGDYEKMFQARGSQALSRLQNIGKPKVSEDTKFVITIGQLRKLIKEASK